MLAVFLIGLFLALPLLYLLSASLMSDSQLTTYPPALVPSHLHFSNYSAAWNYLTPRSVLNSVIFTAAVVGLQWALCISGGLVLAKMQFRLRNVFTAIYGITFFVPFITVLVPTFIVTDKLHLINSYPGLIVPVVAQTGVRHPDLPPIHPLFARRTDRRGKGGRRRLVDRTRTGHRPAVKARYGRVRRHFGADRMEHVRLAAHCDEQALVAGPDRGPRPTGQL